MGARSGERLGAYRLLELLGEGGMGQVYLAEDPRLGRAVALKLLPAEMAGSPERLHRFEREARAVAALNHPGIPAIHSIEEFEGTHFITMERVQGETLSKLIPAQGMPVERFLPLASQIADALAAAHQAGVTHRDLKPDNVMVGPEDRVKILDFGLAKLRQPESDELDLSEGVTASVTRDGRIVGTVAYMSPEQAQGRSVDHRSDIFSLGILLFEMATGQRPFTGETNITVLSSILKDEPGSISQIRQELPRPLARMISRALEKDPGDRYQSALDLRKDLDDLRRDLESGELSGSRMSLPSLLAPGRRPGLPLGLAVGALALVGLVFWLADAGLDSLPPASSEAAAGVDARPSLAVFEFQNLSRDPELEWLRGGLADMLVTDLSQSRGLRVVDTARLHQILARAESADGGQTPFSLVQTVAREADVQTAIVGSFMQAGETLRISARLQDAATGEVLASESVEGAGGEALFGLVDELTQRIRSRLEVTLASGSNDRDLEQVTTSSLQAYRAFVEGMRLHGRLQEEEALPHLERALELDPDFAMAMAKLSVVHGNLGHRAESRDFARRALEHVDRLSERERLYIEGRYYSLEPATLERAIEAYGEAVDRFPDHSAARNNLAQALNDLGRHSEALHHLEELRRQGMTFPGSYESLAATRAAVGEPEKGLEVLEEYADRHPDNAAARLYLANFHAGLEQLDAASLELTRALSLGADPGEVALARWGVAILGGELDEAAEQAELLMEREPARGRALLAVVSAWRGDLDRAVAGVTQASEQAGKEGLEMRLLGPAWLLAAGRPADATRRLAALPALEAGENPPFGAVFEDVLRALAHAFAGDGAAAAAEARAARAKLEELPPSFAPAAHTNVRGLLALAEGRDAEARQLLEESLGLHRPDPMGWNDLPARTLGVLADLAREEGDAATERVWLERLEKVSKGRLMAPVTWLRGQYRLAELLDAAGEGGAAARRYRTFLRCWGEGRTDRAEVAKARERLRELEPPRGS